MALTTVAGSAVSQVASHGMIELINDTPFDADDFNFDLRDLLTISKKQLLSGAVYGCVITASGLTLTLPTNSIYYAGQMWLAGASTTKVVTDNTTSYLWGCSDGILRTTSASTLYPTDFDGSTACLLCKATAASGVVTLDLTVQQRARIVDTIGRMVSENNPCIAPVADTIPATATAVIPSGSQLLVFDTLTINGVLTINGKLRVS